jgi:membrane fusion protein, multidrug efflux system
VRAAGTRRHGTGAKLASLAIVAVSAAFGFYVFREATMMPSTDDATIDADVIHVAAAVGGRIIDLPIVDNLRVAKGDLLFQIDPIPYRLAVEQAHANLELAQAHLDTQRRIVSTQRSAAVVAAEQVHRAETNLDLAARTVERLRPLAAKGYVPTQQFDQAQTAQRDAATSLQQALEQQSAAVQAIDTEAGAEAAVRAQEAALAITQRALADTTVRASHSGYVAGLTVLTGEMIAPTQSLFTLIGDEEWFAVANFRETELRHIGIGDCATVYSMIDRTRAVRGTVQGIGAGVLDTDQINLPRSLPFVERSVNWVRVAQRFPVRVRLESPPRELVKLGASAVVEVKHGAACR